MCVCGLCVCVWSEITETFLVAASMYEVHSVVLAFALTFAVTAALTVYTLQSSRDFSHWGAG